jgi:uncharacterized protein
MEQGIVDGTEAMLSVLGGKGVQSAEQTVPLSGVQIVLLLLFIFGFGWLSIRHPVLAMMLLSNNSIRFGGSRMGGGDSDGFRGGGGSFGGGGASGSW